MANNILTASITIRGLRPLFWHRFGPDALPLEKQERSGVAGNDPMEWKRTVLVANDGRLYLDPSQVFGAIRDGARHTKKGKGSIQALVAATLQVTDDRVFVDRVLPEGDLPTDSSQPVYLDIRGVRNPSTKARNVRYRVAASPGWTATFNILWDRTIVDRNQMQAVLNDTGQLVGIGNGRSIGMGRFEVVEFNLSET